MKTRLSLLMVLALLAALFATSVTRADGPATGGVTGAGGRQTLGLLSILPVSWPGQPADNVAAAAKGSPAAYSHARQDAGRNAGEAPTESWLITWEASTEGYGTYEGWTVSRRSHVTASIVVNYYDDGSSEYYADDYTATFLLDAVDTGPCSGGGGYWKHIRHEITDPTHYSGTGPVTPNTIMPIKPTPWYGTKWTINFVQMVLGAVDGYNRYEAILCGGDREGWDDIHTGYEYTEHLSSDVRAPFNSEDGPLFLYDVDTVFDVTDYAVTYPLHLVEHLRVERLPGLDLTVREVEVTQALQLQDTIPLVQGRSTIVRAYIGIGGHPGPVPGVTGRLRGYNGATLLGEIEPFNMAGSIFAERVPDWRKMDDTLLFELPYSWTLANALSLEVEVNHTRQIAEENYDNNTASVYRPLFNCRPLKIGYMPVRFAPPGVPPASPGTDIAVAHEFLRKVYPVADVELFYLPMPGITWDQPIDGTNEWGFPNAWNLLAAMEELPALSAGSDVDHLVAWLPVSASEELYGLAFDIPSQVAFVRQVKTPDLWRPTLAHETGHMYGAGHTVAMTGGYHWFDVYERYIKKELSYLGLIDFMYEFGLLREAADWVSPESYLTLFANLCLGGSSSTSRPAQAQAAADVLVISGRVSMTATQSGQLESVFHTTGTALTPPNGSAYFVVLKNGTTELSKYGFNPNVQVDASQAYTPTSAPFVLSVPYPAGVNRVELTNEWGQVLNARVASAHPPTVTLQYPNAAGLTLDAVETIEWAASDPDGQTLTYAVLYSKDNGATWNALGADITETSYSADFATFPGSSAALIKVLASDGFNTASDVSDQPFSVPAKPPVAVIVSPPAGAVFKVGEMIKLHGYAADLEEGMVASGSLSWSSDLDGALGAGDLREVTLSEGTHTITLDVSGGAASATTTVVVQVPPPPAEKFYIYLPLVLR